MAELGTRCTTERVQVGNTLPKVARAVLLLDRSEGLRDVIAIGSTRFARGIRAAVAGREEGLQAKRALRRRTTPGEVRAIVEELRGESWQQLSRRRGDWARPIFLWGVRKRCGLTLRETSEAAGGMKPAAVDAAVKRLEKRSSADRALRSAMRKLINRIDSANIESRTLTPLPAWMVGLCRS